MENGIMVVLLGCSTVPSQAPRLRLKRASEVPPPMIAAADPGSTAHLVRPLPFAAAIKSPDLKRRFFARRLSVYSHPLWWVTIQPDARLRASCLFATEALSWGR